MLVISPHIASLTESSLDLPINELGKLLIRLMNSMSKSPLLFFFCY